MPSDTSFQPPHNPVTTSSIITVKSDPDRLGSRDPQVHIRSASPAEGAFLAAQALKASAPQSDPDYDPFDLAITQDNSNGRVAAVSDRWSQSTTGSSATDAARLRSDKTKMATTAAQTNPGAEKPWMKRSSPAGAGSPVSAQVSPHVKAHSPTQGFRPPSINSKLEDYRPGRVGSSGSNGSRTRSPRPASPSSINRVGAPKLRLPLADFNNRPRQSSPLSSPALRSPAARLLTSHGPMGHAGTPLAQVEQADYFGLGIATNKDTRSRPASPGLSVISHASSSRRTSDRQSDTPGSPSSSRPRTKERREKDKKAMLAKALEKANAAVLLDNALDYQGALDEYFDACKLLLSVMDRTTSEDDKKKLNAIRVTYTTRIDELKQLLPESGDKIQALSSVDNETTPRPDANGTPPPLPKDDPKMAMASGAPPTQSRRVNPSRDSFLTDAIREVEGSRSSGFLGPLWEASKNPMANGFFGDEANLSREELHNAGAPSPLAPLRVPSPATPLKNDNRASESGLGTPEQQIGTPQSGAVAMSWLNTIEESRSGVAGALRRPSSVGKARRSTSHNHAPTSELDDAFDAAVDAAYDDGFEQDPSSEPNFMLSSATYGMPAAVIDHKQDHTRTESETQGAESGHGFDFNLNTHPQPASAIPRSGPSETAWPGTLPQHSDAPAATTPYSLLSDSPRHMRKKSNTLSSADYPSNISPARLQPATIEVRPASSSANEGPVSNLAPLAIQTSLSPKRSRTTSRASQATPPGTSAPSVEDVAPWTVRGRPGDFRATRRKDSDDYVYRNPSSALSESTASPTSAGLDNPMSPRYASFQKAQGLFPPPDELPVLTPNSVFSSPGSRRSNDVPQMGQRINTASSGVTTATMSEGGGPHLFDVTLSTKDDPSSSIPQALEPCPESSLLRPFWLLRTIEWAIVCPRGGYLTKRLFMPHEAWLNKTIKLKNVDDKIACCDTLTTSLAKLSTVDSLDAEAVLEELQVFEEIMEKVQATLSKKLGNEVGISGVSTLFKDAGASTESPQENGTRESIKIHSGKAVLTGWRKLRGKTLSGGGNISLNGGRGADGPMHTMSTVPMTSGGVSDKQSAHRRDALRDANFEGPLGNYMSSLARLCDAAQSLDQIARQVEDPGLKHSSPTHVGLELSMRHAAEFFGLWICRFVLADISVLVDKYVKRSTEWLLV